MSARPFSPRKSKLDNHRDVVGSRSDKEVAKLAGVTPENVRTYRLRRGIPASWRGEPSAQVDARTKPTTAPAAAKSPSKRPRKRRASALDPYQDRIGRVPDRHLAELAGVSAENVRAYRKRHGIPAYWRGDGAATNGAPPPALAPRTQAVTTARTNQSGTASDRRFAYKISADVQGTMREYVAFGSNMAEAAAVATQRLAHLHPGAMLRTIAVVGVAL